MSLITCFAAGMLLSMSLCHILPEAIKMYEASKKGGHEDENEGKDGDDDDHENEGDFPLPNIIFLIGFMSLLLIDQVCCKSKKLKAKKVS